jgi:hypothetical protein
LEAGSEQPAARSSRGALAVSAALENFIVDLRSAPRVMGA